MKLYGSMDLGLTSGADANFWRLTIQDKLSRAQIIEVRIPLDEFALALGSRGGRHCEVILHENLDHLGLKHEVKDIDVEVEKGIQYRALTSSNRGNWEKKVSDAVAPYCIDGWTCPDAYRTAENHHRYGGSLGKPTIKFTFHRWVPPTAEDVEAVQNNEVR